MLLIVDPGGIAVLWLGASVVVAWAATRKGRSALTWFGLSLLMTPARRGTALLRPPIP